MESRELFFEDLARALEHWVQLAARALADPSHDLTWTVHGECFRRLHRAVADHGVAETDIAGVLRDCLQGFAVSFLTIIDGGTSLAARSRIALIDENGRSLGQDLHDDFILYLTQEGRMG